MRVANFQNHKQRVALPLLPVTQEGRKRAGALCPVNPRGHLPLGTSNSKTSAQLLRPSLGPALSLLGKEGSHQGAGSVPSSISSETEQWEAGWRDEARNRCRQAWPLSLSLSSEWSQQKEHLATLALPHPASSCLFPGHMAANFALALEMTLNTKFKVLLNIIMLKSCWNVLLSSFGMQVVPWEAKPGTLSCSAQDMRKILFLHPFCHAICSHGGLLHFL